MQQTTAPDVSVSVTVGQVVIVQTATPTATPTSLPSTVSSPASKSTGTYKTAIPTTPSAIPGEQQYIKTPLSIYGYGPSNASVDLSGIGVSGYTTSDSTGYFIFSEIYSYTFTYPELCITAIDIEKRSTNPVCIPPLSTDRIVPREVGPVYLSPTIALSKNNLSLGEEAYVTGFTIPDTEIGVYLAKKERKTFSLINSAYAYKLPEYEIKSNEKGEYEFSLPTQNAASYKLFTYAKAGSINNSKSTTLNLSVLSSGQMIKNSVTDAFSNNKILWLILGEVLLIVYLVIAILKSPTKRHRHTAKDNEDIKQKYLEFLHSRDLSI